jgi:hypothetical protein
MNKGTEVIEAPHTGYAISLSGAIEALLRTLDQNSALLRRGDLGLDREQPSVDRSSVPSSARPAIRQGIVPSGSLILRPVGSSS